MEITASEIASLIDGKIIGNGSVKVHGFSPIENGKEGHLSFIADKKFIHFIGSTESSVLIVSKKLLSEKIYPSVIIEVDDAYLAFQVLMNIYQKKMMVLKEGIEQPSFIHKTACLEKKVYVGAFTYIDENAFVGEGTQIFPQVFIGKNVKIGKNCKIDSGVKIYEDTIIGDNCIIHANTVVGGDGFGFQPVLDGFNKIPQIGNVIFEDDVEVGSNCSIDRATVGSTIIGKGTKIDNLIQIAHNVKIGKHNVIAAQVGIAGSTSIGDWNMIGGQVGIVGHISVGNKVKVQAQSGINTNVKDGEILYGTPAMSAGNFRRNYVHFRKLTELVDKVEKLENKIKNISS